MAAEVSLSQSFAALQLLNVQGHTVEMAQLLKVYPVRLTTVRDFAKAFFIGPVASSKTIKQY
jgi:hypothetical protein